jgi:lysine-N-methylase
MKQPAHVKPTELFALRYLTEFQCTGGDCPDTCCAGMRVGLSQDELVHLRTSAKENKAILEKVDRTVVCTETESNQAGSKNSSNMTYALTNETGQCDFLDQDRLCELHGNLGHDALPNTCAQYPRTFLKIDGRLEASATISCPEIARLSLLKDSSLDLIPVAPKTVPYRRIQNAILPRTTVEHYERHYEQVRSLLITLVDNRDFSFRERLFLLLCFADVIEDTYYLGSVRFDPQILDSAIALFQKPDVLDTTSQKLSELQIPGNHQFEMARDIFSARRPKSQNQNFNQLFDATLYKSEPPDSVPDDLFAIRDQILRTPESLAAQFRQSIKTNGMVSEDVFSEIASRYAKHYLLTQPFTSSPTLVRYLTKMNLAILLARFMFTMHPTILEHASTLPMSTVRSVAAECFQTLTKVVFHVHDFSLLLDHYLVEQGFLKLDRGVQLLPIKP